MQAEDCVAMPRAESAAVIEWQVSRSESLESSADLSTETETKVSHRFYGLASNHRLQPAKGG
jgi:hypothetical protein